MNISYTLAIVGAFLLSLVLVPPIKYLANKFKITDKPNTPRKIHKKNIPLLGGIAIFLSVSITTWVFYFFNLADFSRFPDQALPAILLAGLIIIVGGFLDDKYGLKPWQQIISPVLATVLVIYAGVQMDYITNPVGGDKNAIIYLTPIVGSIISFFWLMGMMYTTKFLDGLDGLATGISAITALVIFLLSLDWDIAGSATGVMALALCGGCLGFLVYNWHPAKIFLGEGGSIYLGFMLGVLSIITGSKITTTLLVIGIPALDVLWVIISRLKKRQSPFSHADQKHLHHRLLKIGLNQKQAVLFLYLIALIFGSLAIFASSFGKLIGLIVLVGLMAIILYSIDNKNNYLQKWYKQQ